MPPELKESRSATLEVISNCPQSCREGGDELYLLDETDHYRYR